MSAGAAHALLADAHALHQARLLSDAARLYYDVLRVEADNPTCLHDFSILLHELGLNDEALGCLDRALSITPNWAIALKNRGIVCMALGQDDAALAALDRAVEIAPDDASSHMVRGELLCRLQRYEEALPSLDAAIGLGLSDPRVFNNHGVALRGTQQRERALLSFQRALQLAPDDMETLGNRGLVLKELGRSGEALADLRRVLAVNPNDVAMRRHEASLLDRLGRFGDAAACFIDLLHRDENDPDDLHGLAMALARLHRYDEALGYADRAVAARADDPTIHTNRGLILLASGKLAEGWKEYEWRWRTPSLPPPNFPQLPWRGEHALDGKTILLFAEQGFGDTLQFCRYVPLVAAQAQVILQVPAPLLRLMRTLGGAGVLVTDGDRLPPFDFHCPLLSLPLAFGTTLATIPRDVPYLFAETERTAAWQTRLADLPGLRVGLVWAGNPRSFDAGLNAVDQRRSMTLRELAPLAEVPGVSLISLQKGDAAAQAPPGMVLHDWTDELEDFADTAALIGALDLVISVDTAAVHLAGALGKPVWLMNRADSCWRWLSDRDDSPWYPTLRQFRQESPGNWSDVVKRICTELRLLAG